ncbi:hypothetical protein ONZ51_g11413 [Trametes cubensis]|uniref:MI domain-containing protein n=1 Tax=Trametes cubensis TaxID=1111947 RepID=A0AAD7X5U1_9APHY|nr:hypothetical protein ONZ51_g11413 [Trametes cubensis]
MATATTMMPTSPSDGYQKRKRSRSPEDSEQPPSSRRRSLSPPPTRLVDVPKVVDVDPARRAERERQLAARIAEKELEKLEKEKEKEKSGMKEPEFDAQAEFAKLTNSRSGGVYMPPARLRAMQEAAAKDKASAEYQRLSWDALRKSITGIVNRVNVANIKHVVPELFQENLIRGRGLFARSVMKAQAASLPFTPVFAALVAIINTKLPMVGELVLTRLISQFRRAFKRNDKIVCHSTTTFIAHLVNQGVAHEIIALQILVLLLERPTDDSIEIAVGFMREVGAFLAENSPKANATVYERFRAVLNEGNISHRVQYMIEVLMQVRKDKYKDNPIIPEGLDLVEEDEQITHQIQLEEELQVQEGLNIFKFDPNFLENEQRYKDIKAEILGEDSSGEEESGSEEDSDEDEEDEEAVEEKQGIEDRTQTNLINLRRVIYLTIMNALNYEEAVHKLLKVQIKEGQEIELCKMIIECCSQERSYSTFYGLIGERFCRLNRVWFDCFEQAFRDYYETIHRYETNRLRNIARFFGHLIASDAVSWTVLDCIKLTEEDTTSSSRIFIKILFQEVTESMGLKMVAERFKDPEVKAACRGMFPMDNPKDTRFAINYFTSIGLGVITEEMREHLKNAPRLIMEQRRAMLEAESSSSDSDSDSDSDDSDDSDNSDTDSDSDSDSASDDSRRHRKRSPSPRRRRDRSDSLGLGTSVTDMPLAGTLPHLVVVTRRLAVAIHPRAVHLHVAAPTRRIVVIATVIMIGTGHELALPLPPLRLLRALDTIGVLDRAHTLRLGGARITGGTTRGRGSVTGLGMTADVVQCPGIGNATETGTLALECVTLAPDDDDKSTPLAASLSAEDRSLYLVLRLNALELPLDPTKPISVRVGPDGGRTYTFQAADTPVGVEPSLIRLAIPIPPRPDAHRAETIEAFDHILAQYAEVEGIAHEPHSVATSRAPDGAQPEDLRGKLVLMDEESGEVVGELPSGVHITEDPALAKAAKGQDGEPAPVLLELPPDVYDAYTGQGTSVVPYHEPESELEEAREIFVSAIPPEDQDWLTKSATFISDLDVDVDAAERPDARCGILYPTLDAVAACLGLADTQGSQRPSAAPASRSTTIVPPKDARDALARICH